MAKTVITLPSFGLTDPGSDKMLMWDDSASALTIAGDGFAVGSITDATALTVEPATTDEMVLSDAGTLKRLDMTHMMNRPAFRANRNIYYNRGTKSNSRCAENRTIHSKQ